MATKQFQNAKLNVTHLDLKDDTSRSVLQSGENISHSLGKIARWYKDIIWTDSKATTEVFGIVKLSDDYKSESTETVPTSKTLNDVVKLIKQTGGWNTTYDFNSNIEGDENLQNGQFKVTEHDIEGDIDHYVSIKGLGSAAYTESSAYATAGHTHKYAGSDSVGGAATSANKLNTDAGSTANPVYFKNGIPVACTYSLNKTVPSNALFTDAKVKQTTTTTDADYEILFSSTADNTTRTEGARKNSNLTFNPSTGALTATKFVGELSGNATTATTANKLSNTTAIGSSIKPVYFSADGIPVAINHSIETSVPSNAVFTDTTYTVSSGDNNGQIKVTPSEGDPYNVSVKGLGSAAYTESSAYATAGHTHKYAGSSSAGGVANSAAKLSDIPTAGIGSETKPVFFSGTTGRPVACTYSLNTTVPANAIFTDEKVKQSPVTTDGSFEVLFAGSTGNTEKTEGVSKTTTLTFNPSTGALSATSFSGNGSGLTSLNASNISSGTLSVNRLPGSAVTVGTYGPAAGGTLSHSGTFDVPDFTVDAKGRITGAHTRTFTLPAQYTHPTHTSKTSGLYKITVDSLGHVSGTAAVTKSDIPTLDYVSSTTTRNPNVVLAGPASGTAAAPTFRALVVADLPSSGATAGSYGPSANATPGYGATFNVPYITIDAKGRVTGIENKTVKIPASDNTDTKVTQTATTASAAYEVLFSGTADNTTRTEGARKNSNLTFNPSTGILTTDRLYSARNTGTYLAGNTGSAIINSTASAGAYVMLARMHSTNGYFTHGTYEGKYLLQYTAQSTIDAGTNEVTKKVILLNESGNSSFPGTVVAATFSGSGASLTSLNASNISSGTLSADRLATSGVTAGSYGPSNNASPAHSGTFNVPYITVDNKGRVTDIATKTITLPSSGNTDKKVTQTATTTDANYEILFSSTADNTTRTEGARKSNNLLFNPSTGVLQISGTEYGAIEIYRKGSAYGAAIEFYNDATNNTKTKLGSICMKDVDGDIIRYLADYSTTHKICDTKNTSFTRSLTSGTKIGTITIAGTSTDLYCQTNTNTTYSFATGDTNGTFKVTPSGGTATNIAIKGLGSAAYTASSAYATASHTHNYAGSSSAGGPATSSNQMSISAITIQTGSSAKSHITLETLMNWLIDTKKIVNSDSKYHSFSTSWSYSKNDILQISINGSNKEVQLAGVIFEIWGSVSTYNSGMFRLRIHTAPKHSYTNTSGYSDIGDATVIEYFCNGSEYAPTWRYVSDRSLITAQETVGLYKIAYDNGGNITKTSAITKADITGLGIPGSDTNTTYTFATGDNSGTFKVTPSGGSATNISIKGISHVAGDSTGSGIVIGGNGLTVLGSGESASALVTAASLGGTDEILYLTSDHDIRFYVNCQTISERKGITLNESLYLYPNNNNVGSVGTSANKWNTMYATTFHGALSGNATSASKWATARTLTLSGSVTGSVSIDGSGNVTLTTTTNHSHNYAGSASAGGPAYSVEGSEGTTEVFRHVWFSKDSVETKRAYSDKFMFEPSLGILKFNSWYPLDITDNTVDLNSYNDGSGKYGYRRYICKTKGGGNNISNKPCDSPFLLEVFLIRFATASKDYITKQVYHAFDKTTYQRFCTNGTWDSWTEMKYTDTKVTQSATTTANFRGVILGTNNTSNTDDNRETTVTGQGYITNKIFAQPSTGNLYASNIYAFVNGTDEVCITLYRSGNSSWRFLNSGGTLSLQNNFYSDKVQSWYNVAQFNYNGANSIKLMTPPQVTGTNRSISYGYGSIDMGICSKNSWSMSIKWLNNARDTVRGSFGAYGAADALSYYYWGTAYNATRLRLYPGTGGGLVSQQSNGFRIATNGYGVIFRVDSDNFYILLTDKKTDGSELTGDNWNSKRPLQIGLSSGVCNINGNAASASKVYSTNTPGSSSHAGYSIPFFSGPIDSSSPEKNDTAASGNKTVLHNGEFRLGLLEGTTSADGYAQLVLGNGIASGTAGNKYGKISLYSSSTYAVQIIPANLTGTRTLTLPNASGTVALTSHTHSYIPTSSAATLFSGTAAASITMTSMSGYTRLVVFCKNTTNTSYFTVELQCVTGYHYHAMTVSPPPAAQTNNKFYGLLFNLSSNTELSVSAGEYSTLTTSASLSTGPTVHITKVLGYKF